MTQAEAARREESALKNFARAILPLVIEWYKDPEHVREFEEWKKQRDMQKKGELLKSQEQSYGEAE